MDKGIRVLLADDHPLVRDGIRTQLAATADIIPIGEAADGFQVQRLCRELQPDVLLLDLSMPGPSPMEIMAYLSEHCPQLKVLVLTAYDDDAYVRGLVAAGVAGYVLKDEASEAVVQAIRTVAQGATWFSRPVIQKLLHLRITRRSEGPDSSLTNRERKIIAMVARGWDNARIAAELDLAEQTVRNYTSRIYSKLGVRSRAEAIIWAREHGLVGD